MITATTTKNLDVLIIGAGMAGLTAAQELQRAGRRVLVLDKSRGIGGRMATRRIGDATFDHGAQFITARDARFVSAMEEWERLGVVKEWCRGFSADGRWPSALARKSLHDLRRKTSGTRPRDRDRESRRGFAKFSEGWQAETASGVSFFAKAVVLTPPVPQSLALLDAGEVALTPE